MATTRDAASNRSAEHYVGVIRRLRALSGVSAPPKVDGQVHQTQTIRRLVYRKNKPVSYNDLTTTYPKLKELDAAVRDVIKFYTVSGKLDLEFPSAEIKDIKAFIAEAKKKTADPPQEFIDSFRTEAQLDEWIKRLGKSWIITVNDLDDRLEDRRRWIKNAENGVDLLPSARGKTLTAAAKNRLVNKKFTANAERPSFNSGVTSLPSWRQSAGIGKTTSYENRESGQASMSFGSLYDAGGGQMTEICPTCLTHTQVYAFEVDHQQAWSRIRDNVHKLAEDMEGNPAILSNLRKNSSFADYFQVTGTGKSITVEPTKFVMATYSNDLTNLVRICRACNGASNKGALALQAWFMQVKGYGKPFLNKYLDKNADLQIIARTVDRRGWGEVMIEWFQTELFPVVVKGRSLTELKVMGESALSEQASYGVQARYEANPTKKRKLEEVEVKHARHAGMVTAAANSSSKYLHSTPYLSRPIGSNSPQLLEDQVDGVYQQRDERKQLEAWALTKSYQDGLAHGRANLKSSPPKSADSRAAYLKGYQTGQREFDIDFQKGREFRIATPVAPVSASWSAGFTAGAQEARDVGQLAYNQGFSDGKKPIIQPTYGGNDAYLKMRYMEGIAAGMGVGTR